MGQIEVVQESNITGGFKTWTIWIRVSSFRAYEISSIDLGEVFRVSELDFAQLCKSSCKDYINIIISITRIGVSFG